MRCIVPAVKIGGTTGGIDVIPVVNAAGPTGCSVSLFQESTSGIGKREGRVLKSLFSRDRFRFLSRRRRSVAEVQQKMTWCDWPWSTLVVNCDGTVVCGCADPRCERPVGDFHNESLEEIWFGPVMSSIRRGLVEGIPEFCQSCGLKQSIDQRDLPSPPPEVPALPTRLFVEPAIFCNISCLDSHCNKESGIVTTRRTGVMTPELFSRIMEQAGPGLQRLELFNYGEPFVNKHLPEFIRTVRDRWPHIFTFASTNGLVWRRDEQLADVLDSGIHELVFSVDGATPETYQHYRRGGDFHRVIRNIERIVAMKQERELSYPIITFRYILFRWNDNDTEMNAARELARRIGVDRLCWEITDHPEGCPSLRFAPGTSDYERIRGELWDQGANANALTEKAPRASIEPSIRDVTTTAGERIEFQVTITNTGHMLWFATSPDNLRYVTLGLQLCDDKRTVMNRDFHRELLPINLHPGQTVTIPVAFSAPGQGCYWLKFDMVLEGYGWFESGQSPVRYVPLQVL